MNPSPKWNPLYTDLLRIHLKEGSSFTSFSGRIRVSQKTIYEWARVNPEFKKVKDECQPPKHRSIYKTA